MVNAVSNIELAELDIDPYSYIDPSINLNSAFFQPRAAFR
jgi:hypothetical protein